MSSVSHSPLCAGSCLIALLNFPQVTGASSFTWVGGDHSALSQWFSLHLAVYCPLLLQNSPSFLSVSACAQLSLCLLTLFFICFVRFPISAHPLNCSIIQGFVFRKQLFSSTITVVSIPSRCESFQSLYLQMLWPSQGPVQHLHLNISQACHTEICEFPAPKTCPTFFSLLHLVTSPAHSYPNKTRNFSYATLCLYPV